MAANDPDLLAFNWIEILVQENVTAEALKTLSAALTTNTHTHTLRLTASYRFLDKVSLMTAGGVEASTKLAALFAAVIRHNQTLNDVELRLGMNGEADGFAVALASNRSITKLGLAQNAYALAGVKALVAALKTNTTLRTLGTSALPQLLLLLLSSVFLLLLSLFYFVPALPPSASASFVTFLLILCFVCTHSLLHRSLMQHHLSRLCCIIGSAFSCRSQHTHRIESECEQNQL